MKISDIPEALSNCVIFPLFDGLKTPNWNFQLNDQGLPEDWVGEDTDPHRELHCGWSKWTWGLDRSKFTRSMRRRKLTGYGVNTRESGLFVVDVDVKNEDGDANWKRFVAGREQPSTFTVVTGTGGYHVYYRAPEGVIYGHTASQLTGAVDTRSGTAYVVGPNSEVSGKSYTVSQDKPLAPMPRWLATVMDDLEAERATHSVPLVDPVNYTPLSSDFPLPWSEKQLRDSVSNVAGAGKGNYRTALFAAAAACGEAGIPEARLQMELFDALPRPNQDKGARTTITDGFARGRSKFEQRLAVGEIWLPEDSYARSTRKSSPPRPRVSLVADEPETGAGEQPAWDMFDAASYEHTFICLRLAEALKGEYQYLHEMKTFIRYQPERGVSKPISDALMSNTIRDMLKREYLEAVAAITEDEDLKEETKRSLKSSARSC